MQETLRIAGIQLDISWEDQEKNFQKVENFLPKLENFDLILLPEMFSTGFSMKSLEFAEDKEGATESFLKHIAHKTGSLVGGGGGLVAVRGRSDGQ